MVVATALRGNRIPLHREKFAFHGASLSIDHLEALFREQREIAIPERDDFPGIGQERGDIAAEKGLLLSPAHDDGAAAVLCRHQVRRIGIRHGTQCIGALKPRARFSNRGHQILAALNLGIHEMGDQFGIGIRKNLGACGLQFSPQFPVVLDDSVVHDHHGTRAMGVGIAFRGFAMGCPARMAETDLAFQGSVPQHAFEIDQLPLGAPHLDGASFQGSHPGRVIAPVFQPAQTIDQHVHGLMFPADISNDSAHTLSPAPPVQMPEAPGPLPEAGLISRPLSLAAVLLRLRSLIRSRVPRALRLGFLFGRGRLFAKPALLTRHPTLDGSLTSPGNRQSILGYIQ